MLRNPDIRNPGGSAGRTAGHSARRRWAPFPSGFSRVFASWGQSLRRWNVWGVLLPVMAAAERGGFSGALLAQQAVPEVSAPSYVFDAILVVVLFGAAVFAICRAGRRN